MEKKLAHELKAIEEIRNQELAVIKEVHESKMEDQAVKLLEKQRELDTLKENQTFKLSLMDNQSQEMMQQEAIIKKKDEQIEELQALLRAHEKDIQAEGLHQIDAVNAKDTEIADLKYELQKSKEGNKEREVELAMLRRTTAELNESLQQQTQSVLEKEKEILKLETQKESAALTQKQQAQVKELREHN